MIYPTLSDTISQLRQEQLVGEARRTALQPLIDYVQAKVHAGAPVNLHFICTHNSRRSHMAQVWAQTAALYFNVAQVHCYSGGTEATALFPRVAGTLSTQGFEVFQIAGGSNPVYAIKAGGNISPVIGFSKTYDSPFNPTADFAAILTCTQADGDCPFIAGAEKRISLPFDDPKQADGSPDQDHVYAARSLEIAAALFYVFSRIHH
ncbi:low molecular weight phosphatase family protein [Sphingobacterium thalpophilum]|uniref:arsenate-mycothiol transferase ArsC n=2 Tax=Sphingobacterium thalpophilum TaxID=259 RepID=UPI003C73F3FF